MVAAAADDVDSRDFGIWMQFTIAALTRRLGDGAPSTPHVAFTKIGRAFFAPNGIGGNPANMYE